MYIFCNNYSEKLSEFHIHDDLYAVDQLRAKERLNVQKKIAQKRVVLSLTIILYR